LNFSKVSKTLAMFGVCLMMYPFKRRKPDLFAVLLIAVTLGMSVTLAYQIHVYHDIDRIPIAKQTPTLGGMGG